jgi:hypothetical protein
LGDQFHTSIIHGMSSVENAGRRMPHSSPL